MKSQPEAKTDQPNDGELSTVRLFVIAALERARQLQEKEAREAKQVNDKPVGPDANHARR